MHAGFQKQIWAQGVGDDWFKRNKHELGNRDLTEDALKSLKITPTSVLEIGCANGWRLKKLKEQYGCIVTGIEPSDTARAAALNDGINVYNGTADQLPREWGQQFDLVIYGFCLCFISPEDWLPMVAESTRVLKDGGHLVIYDFIGTSFVKRRMMNIMEDKKLEEQPVYLYNFNWPTLWLSHPAYRLVGEVFDLTKSEVCTVLRKDMGHLIGDHIKVV